jgi:hypothetical protein
LKKNATTPSRINRDENCYLLVVINFFVRLQIALYSTDRVNKQFDNLFCFSVVFLKSSCKKRKRKPTGPTFSETILSYRIVPTSSHLAYFLSAESLDKKPAKQNLRPTSFFSTNFGHHHHHRCLIFLSPASFFPWKKCYFYSATNNGFSKQRAMDQRSRRNICLL